MLRDGTVEDDNEELLTEGAVGTDAAGTDAAVGVDGIDTGIGGVDASGAEVYAAAAEAIALLGVFRSEVITKGRVVCGGMRVFFMGAC